MKVKFTADEEIRDPKTCEVVSSFKKDQVVELSPGGAAYFFAKGSAEPAEQKSAPEPVAAPEPVGDADQPPVSGRRNR